MAKETERIERPDIGAVVVKIADDNGNISLHTIYILKTDKCPTCGYQPIVGANGVDVDATVTKLCADLDKATKAWNDWKDKQKKK